MLRDHLVYFLPQSQHLVLQRALVPFIRKLALGTLGSWHQMPLLHWVSVLFCPLGFQSKEMCVCVCRHELVELPKQQDCFFNLT